MKRSELVAALVEKRGITEAEANALIDAGKKAAPAPAAEKPRAEVKAAPAPKKAAPVATPKKEAPKAPVAVDYTEEAVYAPEQVYGPPRPTEYAPQEVLNKSIAAFNAAVQRETPERKSLVSRMAGDFAENASWPIGAAKSAASATGRAVNAWETSDIGRSYIEAARRENARNEALQQRMADAQAERVRKASAPSTRELLMAPIPTRPAPAPVATPAPAPAPKPNIYDLSGPTPTQNGKPMVKGGMTVAQKRAKLDAVLELDGNETEAELDGWLANPKIKAALGE